MSYWMKLRGTLVGACAVTLLAGPGLLSLPAEADGLRVSAAAGASSTRSTRPEQQVYTFFGDYRDAILGQHSQGTSAMDVRQEYLTKQLDGALYDWGAANQKDPVFRSQDVPTIDYSWKTADTSPAGHSTVILTEKFEDGTTKDVWYQVNLDGLLIDGITDPPAAS
ncbi:hypothetical protein [Kitasatospora sp. NPDC059327]|uniref:hypothetical protein n=1 Tax=Kitasatospora sp. NPDC059327 TaxID=3346803 RepID=UPI0036A30909